MGKLEINNTDYIAIQGWMPRLCGNPLETMVFGLVHGFSKDGVHKFIGSRAYIAKWCNTSEKNVTRVIDKLVERNLVVRETKQNSQGFRYIELSVNLEEVKKITAVDTQNAKGQNVPTLTDAKGQNVPTLTDAKGQNVPTEGQNVPTPPINIYNINNLTTGSVDGDTAEKRDDAENSKSSEIKTKKNPTPKDAAAPSPKKTYGSQANIKLTDVELERLVKDYGQQCIKDCIEFLSLYKVEKGYKTQSDNLTIRRWVVKAIQERNSRPGANPQARQTTKTAQDYLHLI